VARRGFREFLRGIGHSLFPSVVRERPRQAKPSPEPSAPSREPRRRRARFTLDDDVLMSIPGYGDMDEDEKQELLEDYVRYMIRGEGPYQRNDVRNPFWSASGIHPSNFDWDAWRDDMGYSRGRR
jgi:hypothetical protein